MKLIRTELKQISEDWNSHIISKSINGGPSGRPDTMFFLPHLYDTRSYLIPIEEEEVDEFLPVLEDLPLDHSDEIEEFSNILMTQHEMEIPRNVTEALSLFAFLCNKASEYQHD